MEEITKDILVVIYIAIVLFMAYSISRWISIAHHYRDLLDREEQVHKKAELYKSKRIALLEIEIKNLRHERPSSNRTNDGWDSI